MNRIVQSSTRLTFIVFVLVAGFTSIARAASSACPEHYPGGVSPDIVRPQLAAETYELCFREFAVIYSGISRTPLASAEHLTRDSVQSGRGLRREDVFHEEERLPPDQRARLGDYARSGFDRGHMAPSGDMSTPEAQAESFSLANMVPQDPGSNRCLWEGVESTVRDLAVREGEVWVLTGPIFQGETLRRLDGRVLVPTSLYKAVYVPSRRAAAAYIAPNAPGMEWRIVSLAELRDLIGINAFPSVPGEVQGRAMSLPEPRPHNVRGSCDREGAAVTAHHPRAGQPARGTSAASAAGGYASLIIEALVAIVACFVLYRILGRR